MKTLYISAITLALCLSLNGCTAPRVVFVPSRQSPVRAGSDMRGHVYVWNGTTWEYSANTAYVPEGFYIWDAGDPAPTNSAKVNK